jgi:ABC-type antimicrobial peptide transport system permease subunit
MSVFERTRELGIMMAIGTRPGQIIGMVLAESAIIAFSGIILGVMLGSAIGYYFYVSPWDFSEYTKEMEQFSISTYEFPTRLTIYNLVSTSLATLVLSIVFSIVPALRASRLKPLEAIRHL